VGGGSAPRGAKAPASASSRVSMAVTATAIAATCCNGSTYILLQQGKPGKKAKAEKGVITYNPLTSRGMSLESLCLVKSPSFDRWPRSLHSGAPSR
jgi:hypothetical protein